MNRGRSTSGDAERERACKAMTGMSWDEWQQMQERMDRHQREQMEHAMRAYDEAMADRPSGPTLRVRR